MSYAEKVGAKIPAFRAQVNAEDIKAFAEAIGETNAIHHDEHAARAAGYRSLVAPPTYLFVLDMQGPEILPSLGILGIEQSETLHAGQTFDYFHPICAGDKITVCGRIRSVQTKKDGALVFIEQEQDYYSQAGQLVATTVVTLVKTCEQV